jgi:very-short-patch-repair endonuclease
MWGIWDLDLQAIEVSGPTGKKSVAGVVAHGKRSLSSQEIRRRHDLSVTSIERTLLDIASIVSPSRLEASVDVALCARLTAIPRLDSYLIAVGGRGTRGTKPLRRLVEDRMGTNGPSESDLERRFMAILREEKLPLPDQQVRVPTPLGSARVDFLFSPFRLRVETDGYRWHMSRDRFVRDRRLNNHFTEEGWRNLYYTWWDLTESRRKVGRQMRDVLFAHLPL